MPTAHGPPVCIASDRPSCRCCSLPTPLPLLPLRQPTEAARSDQRSSSHISNTRNERSVNALAHARTVSSDPLGDVAVPRRSPLLLGWQPGALLPLPFGLRLVMRCMLLATFAPGRRRARSPDGWRLLPFGDVARPTSVARPRHIATARHRPAAPSLLLSPSLAQHAKQHATRSTTAISMVHIHCDPRLCPSSSPSLSVRSASPLSLLIRMLSLFRMRS